MLTIYLYILVVCYMPLSGRILPMVEDLGFHVDWFFFFALLLTFVPYAFLKHRVFRLVNIWTILVVAYTVIVFASVGRSNYHFDFATSKELFRSLIFPLCTAIIALNLFGDWSNVRKYSRHICFAAAILSLISIGQMVTGVGVTVVREDMSVRASSTFANPNGLAIFLVFSVPFILYAMEKRFFPKALGAFIALSVIGGVVSTVSRKGIVTMLFAWLLYYLLKRQYKRIMAAGILFVALATVISSYAFITNRFTEKELSRNLYGKAAMAQVGWEMFKTNPVVGWGYRGYYENFGKNFPNQAKVKYDAHNMYVTVLTDYGLLGLVPFVLIFIYPLIISWKVVRGRQAAPASSYAKDAGVICIVAVVPYMISGYFAGGLLYEHAFIPVVYSAIGMVLAMKNNRAAVSTPA